MKKLIQKSMNRQQLLNNTVNHFNSENRCVDKEGVGCRYRFNNRGCAIGREISDSLSEESDLLRSSGVIKIYNKLPNRLKRMGLDFLNEIQKLHDSGYFWSEKGLSNGGKIRLKRICKRFKLDNPIK